MKKLVIILLACSVLVACGGPDGSPCDDGFRECAGVYLLTCEEGAVASVDCNAWCGSLHNSPPGSCQSEPTGSPECWCN